MSLRFTRGKQPDFCRKCLVRFGIIIFCYTFSIHSFSQCESSIPQTIPDPGAITIDLLVSGLVNNDLASPLQGICAVELDFMHEYLGDLTISLISPAGTRVELIGPVTTATTPTNLSRWNIRFLPCASATMPDPGFSAVWSNLQPWQIFTNYNGTYHPQSGCLENFNTGSANGTWQVVVEDHSGLQTGVISRVTLIFCDPAGLSCLQCDPNAGTISPAAINLCVGDNISSSDVAIDFGGNTPPSSFYSYSYLMTLGNNIIRSGFSFSENPLPGMYNICGISYLTSDSSAVNALLAAGDYTALNQAILNGTICAEITSPCMSVNVSDIPDTVQVQEHLCSGETFIYRGETYSNAGIFFQQKDGPGACDSVFRIEITKSELQVTINPPGLLSCGSNNLTLTSQVTGNTGVVTYAWSTNVGNIVGSTTTASINVDQPGQYLLTITDAGCVATTSVSVQADNGFPQIFITGGTITCTNPMVDLFPVYIPTTANLLWNGPFGFTTNVDSITVTIPGTYTLRATNELGCVSVRSVEVEIDTITHPVDIEILEKDCEAQIAILKLINETDIVSWQWSGPNGFTSSEWRPGVTETGTYNFTAIFSNGCSRTSSYFFDGDFTIPDISGPSSDTINCNEAVTLTLSSSVNGVEYIWSSAIGFLTSSPSVTASNPGLYYGKVISPNGCLVEIIVELFQGDDIFEVETFTDILTCTNDTVSIGVNAPAADVFDWINYTGPGDMDSSIQVTTPGIYTIVMTNTDDGCSVTTDIRVLADFTLPTFSVTIDSVTCMDPIADFAFIPFPGYVYDQIYWILPDQSIVEGPLLSSGASGVHQLVGVGANGCLDSLSFLIPFDTIPPVFFLEAEILGCDQQASIATISFDPLSQIMWTGPGGFTSSSFTPVVPDTGIYVATGFGADGCFSTVSVHVESDFSLPDLSIESDTLDCLSPGAPLIAHSFEAIGYEWFDASGNTLGTDSTVFVEDPGMYIVHATGDNQCVAMDTVILNNRDYPTVGILADTFICGLDTMLISASTTEPNPDFVWISLTGDTLGFQQDLVVNDIGPFIITVTGVNGCEGRDTLTIPVNQVTPTAIIEMIGELRCQNRDFVLDGSSSLPANVNYEWISVGGILNSDPNAPTVNASDTGLFVLIVENPVNGCTNIASVKVDEHPDAILGATIELTPQACSGDSNAVITITGLQGGIPDFLYELNGTVPQVDPTFSGLSAGNYLLEIMDSEGCIYDTNIVIEATLPYTVDAGPDIEIHIGETVDLNGMSDIVPEAIFSQTWDSSGVILCQDCLTSMVAPLTTTTYTYTIASETGCVISDEMIVFVIEKGKFFIPNAFTPNSDGVNDEVRLHTGPGVARILQWVIFDRWGDAVFGKIDFLPNDPGVFWDGTTMGNQKLNPGVFPYLLEIELINGNIETHHGSITLIR